MTLAGWIGDGAAEQGEQGVPVVVGSSTVAPDVPAAEASLHHDDLAPFPECSDRLHRRYTLGGPVAWVDVDVP